MSAKFKSSKKKVELEASIDDWDNSEEEEDEKVLINKTQALDLTKDHQSQPSSLPQKKVYQNAWDDGEEQAAESCKIPKQQKEGKELWEEANRLHPQIQPIIQNRSTLPTTLLAPRLSSPSSSSSIGSTSNPSTTIRTSTINLNGEYDHRPPPQILRRDRNAEREAALAAAAALAEGTNKKKTLAEREEEYRKARERIFGASGAGGETRSSSRTGSGSDTGGRNSPISTKNPKTNNTRTKKGR